MQQQTLWHNRTHSKLRTGPLPQRTAQQVLVAAEYSLISLGTERLLICEDIPHDAALHMRVPYMQGEFSDQFTYGYSLVGNVLEGPDALLGQKVHLLHPHQRYALVDSNDVFVLPAALDAQTATLISNMETAVNAVWDARLTVGDSVMIFGYGIIGSLICQLARAIPGIEPIVIEPDPHRAALASKVGLVTHNDSTKLNISVDIAFNTAANSQALQCAINTVGHEGMVIEVSWHGNRASHLSLGGSFHYERKQLLASQVSSIPGHKRSRWSFANRKLLVARLLDGIDTHGFISKHVPFSQADSFFNSLRRQSPVDRGVLIHYQE